MTISLESTIPVIKNSPLFKGVTEEEILTMLRCLQAYTATYEKNRFIYRRGDNPTSLGIVLEGTAHIIEEDYWGNRSILNHVGSGHLFAESYACVESELLRVSVLAIERTSVLFLDVQKVLRTCSSSCDFHARLVRNLLTVLAQKNIMVTEKAGFIARRSTKDKLMAYLSSESQKRDSREFDIPFNRQELADYLAVDRSALSKEIGRLKEEGILDFRKNHFRLT